MYIRQLWHKKRRTMKNHDSSSSYCCNNVSNSLIAFARSDIRILEYFIRQDTNKESLLNSIAALIYSEFSDGSMNIGPPPFSSHNGFTLYSLQIERKVWLESFLSPDSIFEIADCPNGTYRHENTQYETLHLCYVSKVEALTCTLSVCKSAERNAETSPLKENCNCKI